MEPYLPSGVNPHQGDIYNFALQILQDLLEGPSKPPHLSRHQSQVSSVPIIADHNPLQRMPSKLPPSGHTRITDHAPFACILRSLARPLGSQHAFNTGLASCASLRHSRSHLQHPRIPSSASKGWQLHKIRYGRGTIDWKCRRAIMRGGRRRLDAEPPKLRIILLNIQYHGE